MKNLEMKDNKQKTLFMYIVLTAIFIILIIVINIMNNYACNKNINKVILSITNKIQKEYPNINDNDIIDLINGDYSYDHSMLAKYGYDENNSFIKEVRSLQKQNIIINASIILLFATGVIAVYFIYIKNEKDKIRIINNYLKEINNKNYILKIEENGEGELSKLQNELYKTTVLLKETAENNKNEKVMLSNSLADISHQLKTPLTSITIMLDNINDNPNMDKTTKDMFIKEIMKQIDWVNSLVISILKVSKFDSGTIELNSEKIDVKSFIEDIINSLSVLLDVKNINILTSGAKGSFKADYKWQKEAISNILKNAIEHSDENSDISINVENTNLFLKITINDNGRGIPKEDIKHIFERFYKSKNSSENSIGIGLNLAKTIIEKEKGTISVSSELGKGTTFVIEYLKI